jgi:hypothetical protein
MHFIQQGQKSFEICFCFVGAVNVDVEPDGDLSVELEVFGPNVPERDV